jgi:gamma-glutamylputrescine oxidase
MPGARSTRARATSIPLRYALALARAAERAGAAIHEGSIVLGVEKGRPAVLRTEEGELRADHVILAGNGYMPDLEPQVAARVMPINSFIGATEPVPERWRDILAEDIAVADSKFVVNYYRFSEDRRFLFGGRESYGLGFPRTCRAAPQAPRRLFPQLVGARIEHVWGGTLGHHHDAAAADPARGPNILSAGASRATAWRCRGSPGGRWPRRCWARRGASTRSPCCPRRAFPGARSRARRS